jgi:hypothetical protein
MELFFYVSGIGVLILLALHMVDYALESTRQSVDDRRDAVRKEEAKALGGDGWAQRQVAEKYDRAA